MSRCEWPSPSCQSQKARPVEIVNAFGERRRVRYCQEHIEFASDPQKMADLHETMRRRWQVTGATVPPETVYETPEHKALQVHNETCGICAVVAAHIRGMIERGEVKTQDDVQKVGEYIYTHACEVGVKLNYDEGMVMRGRR